MALKIAINGFGRIGRCVARIIAKRDDIELVSINDMANIDMIIYLLKNDSVHGNFNMNIKKISNDQFQIGDEKVKLFSNRNPSKLEFAKSGAELVLECTGSILTQKEAQVHIDNGIKKVLFSAPANDKETKTFVLGVNENEYKGQKIVSNASCTTNCLAPITKILDDSFEIEKGLMTTIHSYTNDQRILDVKHLKDKRRARAAAINIIPTSTGAAKAISLVMPKLLGKLHGQSVRVPIPNVSMIDLNVILKRDTTINEINTLFKDKTEQIPNIISIDDEMRVSQDFIGSQYSAIIAKDLTQVIGGNMVKIMAWYDNEYGYSSRLVDMALHISK